MKTNEANASYYLRAVNGDLWAIHRERMKSYLSTMIGGELTAEEIEARTGPRSIDKRRSIAILPLLGPITQRSGYFSSYFGGTSTEKWGAAFDDLVASEKIGAIVLDVDSPGGEVSGVPELADKVFRARGTKPIIAVANTWAASAAYWIASAADELVVTPSGEVGSIGVWSMHIDWSKYDEEMGVKVTLISAGDYKTEANPWEPLTEEAEAWIQKGVDRYYGMFVAAVAKHRGTTVKTVDNDFGQGRMIGPKEAVAAGMADRVATLEKTVQKLGGMLADRADMLRAAEQRQEELRGMELVSADGKRSL